MRKLFANASYSFSNFYSNLNTQGQIIFSVIIGLILILCILLFINFLINSSRKKKNIETFNEEKKEQITNKKEEVIKEDDSLYIREETEIDDIAKRVEEALREDAPITLTSFEEDQEKTAIISIDELMMKAKELDLINDDDIDNQKVNYLEKYNLEPVEVTNAAKIAMNEEKEELTKEVKAFKVSQVISPVYGIKKDNNDN